MARSTVVHGFGRKRSVVHGQIDDGARFPKNRTIVHDWTWSREEGSRHRQIQEHKTPGQTDASKPDAGPGDGMAPESCTIDDPVVHYRQSTVVHGQIDGSAWFREETLGSALSSVYFPSGGVVPQPHAINHSMHQDGAAGGRSDPLNAIFPKRVPQEPAPLKHEAAQRTKEAKPPEQRSGASRRPPAAPQSRKRDPNAPSHLIA